MRYKTYILASLIAALLLTAGCGKVTPGTSETTTSPATETTTKFEPADNALPDFSVELVGGGTFTLYENLGKPLFISMFSTSDASGVEGLKHIERLYKEMGDKATFLVINAGGDETSTKAFAQEKGYTLPFGFTSDVNGPFGEEYALNPQTLILNASGVLTNYFPGASDYDNYYDALRKAGQDLPVIENPVQPSKVPKEFTGGIMPAFSVPMVGGGDFVFSGKPDKPVLINLFATWCGTCWEEMPHIEKLYKDMGSKADFLIIDIGEDEQTAKGYINEVGNTIPFAYSVKGSPFKDYPVQFLPQTFIVDTNGNITAYFAGPSDYNSFRAALEAVVKT